MAQNQTFFPKYNFPAKWLKFFSDLFWHLKSQNMFLLKRLSFSSSFFLQRPSWLGKEKAAPNKIWFKSTRAMTIRDILFSYLRNVAPLVWANGFQPGRKANKNIKTFRKIHSLLYKNPLLWTCWFRLTFKIFITCDNHFNFFSPLAFTFYNKQLSVKKQKAMKNLKYPSKATQLSQKH